MAARRSTELKPVPEYDRFSSAVVGGDNGTPSAATLPAHTGGLGHDNIRSDGASGIGNSNNPGATRDGASTAPPLGHVSMPRFGRLASISRSYNSTLGRTSIVTKLQQGGRQLMDLGRLQADWLSNTLVKKSDDQDYINEEDQGFVALLARHVELPAHAWQKLQEDMGRPDGHFWQSSYAPDKSARNSVLQQQQQQQQSRENASSLNQRWNNGTAEDGGVQESRKKESHRSIFGLPVIQPYNLFAVLWTMLILFLDLTYTAFWVPMNVAFCTSEYGRLSSGCTKSDLVGGALYFLNALLGFQIGVVATNGVRKRTVVDGRLVAKLYIRYGKFWLDFVASIPMLYLIVVLAGQSHFRLNKGWVNCLSLLRLLRMVRLLSISKVLYMDSLSGRFQDSWIARLTSVTVLYSVLLAYQLAVAINLFACIMVLCAYFEGYNNSWMTAVDWANLPNASPLYQWFCAVYWMIVTATTTGFGDFQPRSMAEQVVSNVVMVGGMIMFGVLVASIGQALSRVTREAHQAYGARQKVLHVMDWAQRRHLPDHLKKRVQNFFADKYGRKEEEAVDMVMMASLPSRLRAKVALSVCSPLVCEVHILGSLPDDLRNLLAENMRPLRLPPGEDLCQQGDITNCLWILQEGTVEAVRYKEPPVTLVANGTARLLGESVLLGEAVEASRFRPWTLRTTTPCRLWGITLGELYPLMRMYPIIGCTAAEYVKTKTVALHFEAEGGGCEVNILGNVLGHQTNAGHNGHWCEVATVIHRQLEGYNDKDEAERLVRELAKASAVDGTLQPLLDHLLEFCATRRTSTIHPPTDFSYPSAVRPDTFRSLSAGTAAAVAAAAAAAAAAPRGTLSGMDAAAAAAAAPAAAAAAGNLLGRGQGPAAAAGASAFGTPAAAAALTAALLGVTSGQPDLAQQPFPHHLQSQLQLQQLQPLQQQQGLGLQPSYVSSGGGGGGGGLVATSAAAAANAAAGTAAVRLNAQLAAASPLSAVAAAAVSSGGGSSVVHCPGCQRCICPSCGQGMDSVSMLAAGVLPATAAAPVAGAGGALGRLGGVGLTPGTRAWVNSRQGTLRRVSIGLRADQAWAMERRSMEPRLNAMSVVSLYE